jgi:hypothetical protein
MTHDDLIEHCVWDLLREAPDVEDMIQNRIAAWMALGASQTAVRKQGGKNAFSD